MTTLIKEAEDKLSNEQRLVAIRNFQNIWKLVERDLGHLEAVFSENSRFRKLYVMLGGDVATFKAAVKAVSNLDSELMDVNMSVGMHDKNEKHW